MAVNYFVNNNKVSSQKLKGNANSTLTNTDKTSVKQNINNIVNNQPTNYFSCVDINGVSDPSQINNPEVSSWKYDNGTINVRVGRPLGYFNDDGQWVDLNSDMKLTDVFPNTQLASGRDAAIKKNAYWLVQDSDHRKNFGDDNCKFDTTVLNAFTPNSWGAFNWKYYVNDPDSLSSDGPLKVLSSVKKADK